MNSMSKLSLPEDSTGWPEMSRQIWESKYRLKEACGAPIDLTIEDSWRRVAKALAAAEDGPGHWEAQFYSALKGFRFLPAGRILSGAGSGRRVTLFNCFVMGQIEDDLASIFSHLKEAALTLQQGGGIGYDFSPLRPKGALVKSVASDASGPLSFMDVWDSMCDTIMSAGSRRGAMMATLRCDHPDIESFVEAKRRKGRLENFNLSVLITDAFMEAVNKDAEWPLVHNGQIYRTINARSLWHKIMREAYDHAEPGVIFIDQINKRNNLAYCETITATNPCGEQPLPAYGACLLGSINLATLVENPFTPAATIPQSKLAHLVSIAVRMLDNAIEVSQFPLEKQKEEAKAKRRIGLGITGLADALAMSRVCYGSEESLRLAAGWARTIARAAYRESARLAQEKGAFPLFNPNAFLHSPMIQALDDEIKAAIASAGLRNALLTSIAPTGTISLLAGNVSSGIEPIFDFSYTRKVLDRDGTTRTIEVQDYAVCLYRQAFGEDAPLPPYFVTAQTLAPAKHLRMQATLQQYVDGAISKTLNCPEDIPFEEFKTIYHEAYRLGCKGCTTFRPNPLRTPVLETKPAGEPNPKPHPAPAADPAEPLARPDMLTGTTYKLRWPGSEHAFYVTINDIEHDGGRRPFEIFINSKDLEHYAWVVGLTRMISAIFRHRGDISFVTQELKAVFDPQGGHWHGGRYVPSLIAAIGEILEHHMQAIGVFNSPHPAVPREDLTAARPPGGFCPKCHQPRLVKQEGCLTCKYCGWSKCA